jgi:hypothetical protein
MAMSGIAAAASRNLSVPPFFNADLPLANDAAPAIASDLRRTSTNPKRRFVTVPPKAKQ